MSELPSFDRIMWRGKTLEAMSEGELRSALRDCWIERRDRARAAVHPAPEPTTRADVKSAVSGLADIFSEIFSGKKP